jgi:predicted transglutaminase-like cysteine proteinase
MPSPDELRAAIAEGREELRAALQSAHQETWQLRPMGGESEGAWSAREVAEHVIPAEAFFATAICKACGYPGVEFERREYHTPADALQALDEVIEVTNKKIKYVTDTDLEKTDERWGSVENLMKVSAGHLKDHAAQIRTASGAARV